MVRGVRVVNQTESKDIAFTFTLPALDDCFAAPFDVLRGVEVAPTKSARNVFPDQPVFLILLDVAGFATRTVHPHGA